MSRIEPIHPPYSDEVAHTFAKLVPPGMEPLALFRTVAHNPRLLRRMQRGGLLDPGAVSLRLRELVILRTCSLCGADYEWGVHAALFGAAAQLDATALAAVCQPDLGDFAWSAEERLALRLCDELHATAQVSPGLWTELAAHFDPAQLLELVMLAGLYHAVSFIVNATEVEPESWAVPHPPR